MSTGEVEVQDLTELTTLASGDAFLVIDDPSGTPAAKYITINNLLAALSTLGTDGSGNVGIGTAGPDNLLHVNSTSSGDGILIQSKTAGTGDTANLFFKVTTDTADAYRKAAVIFERSATGYGKGSLHLAVDSVSDEGDVAVSDAKVTIEEDGNVGIGTTAPSQILDCNAGSGNMIADGYDNHPSFSYLKEDIQPVASALDALVASPPKTFRRQPFVSAEELRAFALREHMDAWIAEFGGEINEDGELVGDDYRGDKLRNISDPELLAAVDAEADRLREERRAEFEWQRRHVGPIIDDSNIETNLPDMLIQNETGEVTGWSLQSYAGYLHQAIIELAERVAG
jgi:hypothetical protein